MTKNITPVFVTAHSEHPDVIIVNYPKAIPQSSYSQKYRTSKDPGLNKNV
jgi:hypothetical protein